MAAPYYSPFLRRLVDPTDRDGFDIAFQDFAVVHGAAEQIDLVHRLGRSRPSQLRRSIGGEHDEWR